MSDETNLTSEQKAQMDLKIEARYFTRSGVLMLFPIFLAFAARVVFFLYPQSACVLAEMPLVMVLWPQNALLQQLIAAGDYSTEGRCMFLAMHSILSAACIIWLLICAFFEASRTDNAFAIPLLKIGLITGFISTISLLATNFKSYKSLYALSYAQSIDINLWKSLPLILLTFFSAGILVGRAFAYRRSILTNGELCTTRNMQKHN